MRGVTVPKDGARRTQLTWAMQAPYGYTLRLSRAFPRAWRAMFASTRARAGASGRFSGNGGKW
jgi:hypothetical protein